jgi:hypothetical protein
MGVLSVFDDESGLMIGCANPIYLTSGLDYEPGAEIVFEVDERDSSMLKARLGRREQYGIDTSKPPFFAVLTSLNPCRSTQFALLALERPTLRAVLKVEGFSTIDVKAEVIEKS